MAKDYMGGGGMPSQSPKRSRDDVTKVTEARPHSGPGMSGWKGRSRSEVTQVSTAKKC